MLEFSSSDCIQELMEVRAASIHWHPASQVQTSVRIALKRVVQQIISEKQVGWVCVWGGGCVYSYGVAEVHTHTAAEASMCENRLFLKEPVGLFATFSCQVLICSTGGGAKCCPSLQPQIPESPAEVSDASAGWDG